MAAPSVALELLPDPDDRIVETERELVGGLILAPDAIDSVRALVTPGDFLDRASGAIYAVLLEERTDDLAVIRRRLEERGELEMIGGPRTLGRISMHMPGPALLPGMAEDVSLARLDREIRMQAERVARNPANLEAIDELTVLRDQAGGLRARRAIGQLGLEDISFSGETLTALLDEPQPEPVYPGVPPQGHLSLLIAPSFSGKTSLALWVGMARVRGQAPWYGAPAREPGRVLFYSIDEAPGQVAWRMKDLSARHPAVRGMADCAHRFTITGPHPRIDASKLERLRFDEDGLRILDSFLAEAERAGDPFTDVIIDAYSDLLPAGEEDTSNVEATRIGGALERMAVARGAAIQLIHHAGKPKVGVDPPDPRDLGRGASALAAKARAIFTFEEEPGLQGVRKIRTRTNLTATPGPLLLEVSDARTGDTAVRIDFVRPHDTATAHPIDSLLSVEDGWITTNELARRMSPEPLAPGQKVSGAIHREASKLRGIWDNAGLVEIRKGERNALELRRIK